MSGNHSEIFLKSARDGGAIFYFSFEEMALRDQGGNIVPLRRQSAHLLSVLADQPGKIVSKDELIDKVWGKIAVTDDSLNQCISDVRKAIGDTDKTVLQTHPRKGYSLVVQDKETGEDHANTRMGLRKALFAALIALIAILGAWFWRDQSPEARLPSIAVLAFDDLSPHPDRGYLSDAISEGIITELARFTPFTTIARNSSFTFRDEPHDVRQIGETLNADYILEGSQRKQGDLLQVTAQLINAQSGTHIWAETYNGTLDEMFEFQSEIIRQVASTVGGRLAVYPGLTGDRNTLVAMNLSAQGLVHLRTSGLAAKEKARLFFEQAIAADPNAATGYLGMGFYYRNLAQHAVDPEVRDQAARDAEAMANNALEIAPDNYLTHYLLGHLHVLAGDISLARARYDKVKELNPSFSNVFVGSSSTKIYTGDTDGAIADIKYAMKIDPLHPEWFHGQLAWAYWAANECSAADASFQSMTRVPPVTQKTWAAVLACVGEKEKAEEAMEIYIRIRPGTTLKAERDRLERVWVAGDQLDRWLNDLRSAGMPE